MLVIPLLSLVTFFHGSIPGSIESDAVLSERLSSSDDEHHDDLKVLRSLLGEEWKPLQSKLFSAISSPPAGSVTAAARNFGGQVVLTHMDAQSLNLLVQMESHVSGTHEHNAASVSEIPMKLIDYEYAGFNPRVADLANTFCEHCDMNNICAKYDAEYPTLEQQGYFLRAYVDEVLWLSSDNECNSLGQFYTNANEKAREEFIMALGQEIGTLYAVISSRMGCLELRTARQSATVPWRHR